MMYRSDPNRIPRDGHCTSTNSQLTHSTTIKRPRNQERRQELPPELPQVSKEWLASPQNLSIHSSYLSPHRPHTRKAINTNPSSQRRWSSLIPLPASNSSPPQDALAPPDYSSSLNSQGQANSPSSSVRPRRRSANLTLLPKPRPQSFCFGPSPSNADPLSPTQCHNVERTIRPPSNSSYVMVIPPNPNPNPNPPDPTELNPPPGTSPKKKFFKTVSTRLRSLFHPTANPNIKQSPRTRPTTLDQARNNPIKRHSALVTRSEFSQAPIPQPAFRPSSMIISGSWSHAHHGHEALLPPFFYPNRGPEGIRMDGDTTMIEEEEEYEHEGDEDEPVRQANRLKALKHLEKHQLHQKKRIMTDKSEEEVTKMREQQSHLSPRTTDIHIQERPSNEINYDYDFTTDDQYSQNSPLRFSLEKANHRLSPNDFNAYQVQPLHLDFLHDQNANHPMARRTATDPVEEAPDASGVYPNSLPPRSPPGGSTPPPRHRPIGPHGGSCCSGEQHSQPSVMPILTHTRASNFPFRRRRASSPSAHHDSTDPLDIPSEPDATTPPVSHPANTPSTFEKQACSPPTPDQSHPCNPSNPVQSASRIRHPFRHRSTHFEKFQAKMATVKLRSSTLNPTAARTFSSGFSSFLPSANLANANDTTLNPSGRLPSPIGIRLSWETSQTELLTDMPLDGSRCPSPIAHPQPFTSPSFVSMLDHNSDSSSHLTLNSEPSSNKLSKSSPCVSNLPPQIELSLSFHSSETTGLPYSESHPSPTPQQRPEQHPRDGTLSSHPTLPTFDGSPRLAKPILPPLNNHSNVRSKAASPPANQVSNPPNEINGASTLINNRASNLSSRVRPTPSPRPHLNLNDGPAVPASSSLPTARLAGVPARLSHLPRLNSYSVSSSNDHEPSESSSSNGHFDSVEDEVVDDDQDGSVQSDGIPDEEDVESTHHQREHTAVPPPSLASNFLSAAPTFPDKWIPRGTVTPPVSKPINVPAQLPTSSSVSYPEDQSSSAAILASPGHRARCLLLSTASPPPIKSSLHPRPSTDSRRSHSAVDLSQIGSNVSSPGSPTAVKNPESILKSSLPSPLHPALQNAAVMPSIVVDATSVVSSSSVVRPQAVPRDALSPDYGMISQRHQSMYEFRPSTNLPSYDSHRPSITPTIVPREEEGREKLPPYSCAIHLEGWMPRKMEFKSPGVQARDRSWKRQYVILHGTMIRIYRSDPHAHPLSASNDAYSCNFINSGSSSLLASTCGIDTKRSSEAPPLHFHHGKYDAAPVTSFKEAALVKAVHQNSVQRVYTLQNAESGLAADYVKRKYVVRVRAEGEQFLLQAKNDRGVIDLIEALQAATNVSLDLDGRPLPKFITLPRRRRRRRVQAATSDSNRMDGAGRREIGTAIVESMVAEAEATGHGRRREHAWGEENSDRMADMLAEEQEAYLQSRN